MKPYESYKPSGVSWLGDVPAHWEMNTIKRGYEITLGKMLQTEQKASTDVSAPYLRSANVQAEKVDVSDVRTMWFTEHEVQQLVLEPNDLVVCEGGDAGRSAIWHGEVDGCYFQNSVNRVRGVGSNTTLYLMRWLDVVKSCGYMDIVCNKATIAHLTKEKLANLPMLFPPQDEQQAIADYLDVETARIDTLIYEKEELIGLLREARASVVDRAIQPHQTKAVSLKRYVTGIATGPFGSALHAEDYVSGGPFLINPTHIVDGKLVPDADVSLSDEAAKSLSAYRFKAGDIVVGRRGEMGRCAVIPSDGDAYYCGTGCLMLFPDTSKVVPAYLSMVISSTPSKDWLSLESVGSTMENLNSGILGRLPCFVPSMEEQKSLLENVLAETAACDSLRTYVQEEITLLKELRAATIADAVLGRVDVRTATKQ